MLFYCNWPLGLFVVVTSQMQQYDLSRIDNADRVNELNNTEIRLAHCVKLTSDSFRNFTVFVNVIVSSHQTHCSFPFTYNGRIVYNCTQSDINSNEVGCFSDKGVWITCPLSQLSKYELMSECIIVLYIVISSFITLSTNRNSYRTGDHKR